MKQSTSKYCSFCEHTGIIHEEHFEHFGEVPLKPCPKCVANRCKCGGESPYYYSENQRVVDCFCREVRMKIDRIIKIYYKSGIEKKFLWKFLGDYNSVTKAASDAKNAAYDIVKKFPNVNKGLFLWGNPGTGKTLLSSIILTEIVSRYAIDSKFLKISRNFFGKIKSTFNEKSEMYGESEKIERAFAEVDLLVIDDFGVERGSPWEQETLYNLVDARYETEKFTIFTSNVNPLKMIKDPSGERIVSRIKEMCRIMEISGDDYRERL